VQKRHKFLQPASEIREVNYKCRKCGSSLFTISISFHSVIDLMITQVKCAKCAYVSFSFYAPWLKEQFRR